MFAQSDASIVADVLGAAGFVGIDLESVDVTLTLGRTVDEALTYLAETGPGAPPGGCGIFHFGAFPTLPALLAQQQALGPRTILGRPSSEIGKDYFYGFTDIATWDIADNLTLKNIAAARVFKQLGVDDFSSIGLPIAIFGFPGNNHGWNNNEVQYTEELQLSGKALNDRLDWRVGGFLLFDHPLGDTTIVLDGLGSTIFNHYNESSRSQAETACWLLRASRRRAARAWLALIRLASGARPARGNADVAGGA